MSLHVVPRTLLVYQQLRRWIVIVMAVFWTASISGQSLTLSVPPDRAHNGLAYSIFQGPPGSITTVIDAALNPPGLHLIWDASGAGTWDGQPGWTYRAYTTIPLSSLNGWYVGDSVTIEWAPLTGGLTLAGLNWAYYPANPGPNGLRSFFIPPARKGHSLVAVQPLEGGGTSVTPLSVTNLTLPVTADAQGASGTNNQHGQAVVSLKRGRPFWITDMTEDPPLRSAEGVLDLTKTNWTPDLSQIPLVTVTFYLDRELEGQRFTIHSRRTGFSEQMQSVLASKITVPTETLLWNGFPLSIAPNVASKVSAVVMADSEVWLTRDIDTYPPGTGDIYVLLGAAAYSNFANWTLFGAYPEPARQNITVYVNQNTTQNLFVQQAGGVFPLTREEGAYEINDYTWEGYDNTFRYYIYTGSILSQNGTYGNQDYWVFTASGQPVSEVANLTWIYAGWEWIGGSPVDPPPPAEVEFIVKLPSARIGHDMWISGASSGWPVSPYPSEEPYLWRDPWHGEDIDLGSSVFSFTGPVPEYGSYYLYNNTTGESADIYPGTNDRRTWFPPRAYASKTGAIL